MAPKTERQKLSVPIGPQLGNLDLGGPSERNLIFGGVLGYTDPCISIGGGGERESPRKNVCLRARMFAFAYEFVLLARLRG